VARKRELVGLQDGGEVDERAMDGRHRDAAKARRVPRIDVQRPDRVDAGDTALGGSEHLWRWWPALDQARQVRGGSAAEHRSLATGEDGGEVLALDALGGVADRINAPVSPDEVAGPDAVADLSRREAGGQELLADHVSLLPIRNSPDNFLRCPALRVHMTR
jgi:hypothetical protein